ncbi:MAG: UDP-N-acetylmuramoyl-tripeptide--D-alanyl-D-alanine ligase [Planctomycetes bacterium]|nr:UDP-N-acetylmuramoyl-tripeptide--D-alanyl-D-alanine ligase [Planctomycetota bacterium]
MIAMTVADIAAAIGGRLEGPGGELRVTGLATDTRRVRAGDCFFALDGARFRGSDFLDEAFRAGAVMAVSSRPRPVSGPVIEAADPGQALIDLATILRSRLRARVVAITGSNGKTTTKDALARVLAGRLRVVAPEGSFNNRVGLPLTIARADENTEALVLELGTSLPGEIRRLTAVARPQHAIFTSIGASHLEGLGSIEGVLAEKLDLLAGLQDGGLVVVNGDDPMLAGARVAERVAAAGGRLLRVGLGADNDLVAIEPRSDGARSSFALGPGGPRFEAALPGRHNLGNLLAVVAMARELGLDDDEIRVGFGELRPSRWRMETVEREGATYVLDCYNANPSSMRAAIAHLAERRHPGRKIAVLGDMLELGAESVARHEEVGLRLAEAAPALVVLVGREMRAAEPVCRSLGLETIQVENVVQARAELRLQLRPGDLVLVKGSRGMAMEGLLGEGS